MSKDHKIKTDITKRRRTLTRIMAVQVFYQFEFFEKKQDLDVLKNNLVENYALHADEEVSSYREKIDYEFLRNLVNGLSLAHVEIDQEVTSFLRGEWTLEKLPNILLQILRFGAFELKFTRDIPFKVLINEYVDIAAMFFDSTKITFVNSVLENLAKKYRAEEFK